MVDDNETQPNQNQAASEPPPRFTIIPMNTTVPSFDPNAGHPANVHSSRDEIEPTRKWFTSPHWWLAILTGFLVFVGGATAIVFYRQLREMQTQTGIISKQTEAVEIDARTARRHSRQQLREMQAQVDAIKRQMRVEQRPWVYALKNGDFNFTQLSLALRLINMGKTPARNVVAVAFVDVVRNGTALDFSRWRTHNIAHNRGFLGAKGAAPGTALCRAASSHLPFRLI